MDIEAIYFVLVPSNKLIIPCFDVSKAKTIKENLIQEWDEFIITMQKKYDGDNSYDVFVNNLKKEYKVVINNNITIGLPIHFEGGLIKNFPDLYNANNNQLIDFVKKTKITLDKIKIRTGEKQVVCTYNIHPVNFLNLNFTDSIWLAEQAKLQNNKKIWISIVVWWKYRSTSIPGNSNVGKYRNSEDIVYLIENYCLPEIYNCDFFIMLTARALELNDHNLLSWIEKSKSKILWDSDALSDTPQSHIYKCKDFFHNQLFINECKRCGIK